MSPFLTMARRAHRALALAFLLPACSSLVPSTLLDLRSLDPLSADPAEIELALILPPGLMPRPDGARLELKATRPGHEVAESFLLTTRPAPDLPRPDGATLLSYGLSPEGATRMRAAQSAMAAWPQDGQTHGILAAALDACLTGGPLPAEAEGAVLIRLAADAEFQPLLRPTPIVALIGPEAMATLTPCTEKPLP